MLHEWDTYVLEVISMVNPDPFNTDVVISHCEPNVKGDTYVLPGYWHHMTLSPTIAYHASVGVGVIRAVIALIKSHLQTHLIFPISNELETTFDTSRSLAETQVWTELYPSTTSLSISQGVWRKSAFQIHPLGIEHDIDPLLESVCPELRCISGLVEPWNGGAFCDTRS